MEAIQSLLLDREDRKINDEMFAISDGKKEYATIGSYNH
jgi:hypothetical protein